MSERSGSHKPKPPQRRSWLWLVKLAISLGLLYLVVSNVDIAGATSKLRDAAPEGIAGGLALLLVNIFLAAVRWSWVMRTLGNRLTFLAALQITYIGIFFNSALPSTVGGDAVRVWELTRRGIGLGKAVNGVLLDRIAAVIALVVLVSASNLLFLDLSDSPSLQYLIVALTLGLLAAIPILTFIDRLPITLVRFRLMRGLVNLGGDARTLFFSLRQALPVIVLSLAIQIIVAVVVFVLAQSLLVPIGFSACLVFMPLVLLISTIPVSIAGWGVREAAMVTAFSTVGIPATDSLLVSIAFGLSLTVVSLPGGVVWLASRRPLDG